MTGTVMIDHATEKLTPLEDSGSLIPGNPSRATLFRWALKGMKGLKLETLMVGSRRFTSIEAISRFIGAQNQPTLAAPVVTAAQRRTRAETANQLLIAAGV